MAEPLPESGPAVLMVTRRFWPHTDDAIGRLGVLAEGLRRSGARPLLMAARYAASWPHSLVYREVPVVRPVAAPRGDWSGGLYQRSLTRWLREQAGNFDVLYADNMREEGAAVVDAAIRAGVPSLVRCGGTGALADAHWASGSRAARRMFNQSLRAGGLIAPTAAAARALISCGAAPGKVHRIDDGVPAGPRRDPALVAAARASLAAVNGDLLVPSGGRVVLCNASLTGSSGVLELAEAIVPLCQHWPELRVWFVGDGPAREPLHRFLREQGVRGATALPGCFGHVDELLRAADVVVVPSDSEGLEQRLPAALGAGLPAVLPDTAEVRGLLGAEVEGTWLFPSGDVVGLRRALRSTLEDYPRMLDRATEIRGGLRRRLPRERSITAHLNLMLQMLGSDRPADFGQSTGAMP